MPKSDSAYNSGLETTLTGFISMISMALMPFPSHNVVHLLAYNYDEKWNGGDVLCFALKAECVPFLKYYS